MLTINDNDFQRLVKFVHENYGIDLTKKRQLITGRLSNTILSMGFSSFQEYVDHLIKNRKPEDLELMALILNCLQIQSFRIWKKQKKTGCLVYGAPDALPEKSLIQFQYC